MNTTKINVKWGTPVKFITLIVCAIVIAAEYYLITSLLLSFDWSVLIASCIMPLIFLYFLLESPKFLEVNKTDIIVHKWKGKLTINYEQISKIEPYKPDYTDIRRIGSGGVFGFIGKFSNSTIGNYQSYVGDNKQAFLIETKEGKKYVLSCENRDLVINMIKKQMQL
ncbi:MAG: PH domain-containing protein [Dysgonamonadaceae bacterium]|jgi:hypothetical protein|nr:PH domain-containing protein [Dysgonamonadaceae bacterium]